MDRKEGGEVKRSKEPEGAKTPKDSNAPKGTQTLRIPSPLSPQLDQLVYDIIGVGMRVHSVLGGGPA